MRTCLPPVVVHGNAEAVFDPVQCLVITVLASDEQGSKPEKWRIIYKYAVAIYMLQNLRQVNLSINNFHQEPVRLSVMIWEFINLMRKQEEVIAVI